MNWKVMRAIALFLAVLMAFYTLPQVVVGEPFWGEVEAETDIDNIGEYADDPQEDTYEAFEEAGTADLTAADVVGEVEELREENIKHFRLEDGSYIAVKYDTAVHYLNGEDEWVDINNSLVEEEVVIETPEDSESSFQEAVPESAEALPQAAVIDRLDNPVGQAEADTELTIVEYQAEDTVADIRIAQESGLEEVADFEISNEDYAVGFSMVDAEGREAEVVPAETLEDDNSIAAAVTLPNITSVARYTDVLEGVDLEYVLHGNDVKENIIVKERRDSYTFSFDMNLQNLVPHTQEDGSISLVDRDTGEEIYLIPTPYMEDAEGILSMDVRYELIPAAEFYGARADEELQTETLEEAPALPASPALDEASETEMADAAVATEYSVAEETIETATIAGSEQDPSSEPQTDQEEPALQVQEEQEEIREYGENEYVFTVIADESWMEEKERAYPVTIDPPIIITMYGNSTTNNYMNTAYVMSGSPNTATGGYGEMYVGYSGVAATQKTRIYMRINNLPTLPANCNLVNAGIYFCQLEYSQVGMSDMKVAVQPLEAGDANSGSWINSITWNNRKSLASEVLDYQTLSAISAYTYVGWDITGITKRWYSGETNYGLGFLPTQEGSFSGSKCANTKFVSYNTNSYANYKPKFIVQYRNVVGLEDYYTYDVQGVDQAGTAYIGDYSGGLTVVNPVLSNASTAMPFSLSMVYNTGYALRNFTKNGATANTRDFSKMLMGQGWKLSVQETVAELTMKDANGASKLYLVHNDSDGTEHYYSLDTSKNDGYYYDEDGLGLKIKKNGSNYTMSDEKNNIREFYNGILGMIKDRNGNIIRMIYNNSGAASSGTGWQPTGSGDRLVQIRQQNNGGTEITLATFTYDSGNYLSTITDRAGRTARFGYHTTANAARNLFTITHLDGVMASYDYGGSKGEMTSLKDYNTDRRMDFAYAGTVNYYQEVAGGVVGDYTWRGQDVGKTRYRHPGADRQINTADDTLDYVLFDYYGRTTNYYVLDNSLKEVLGASAEKYTVTSGTSKSNNKVAETTSLGVSATNYLPNGTLENTSTVSWQATGSGLSIGTAKPRTGTRGMQATTSTDSRYKQTVNLTANKTYTLSAYVNTSSVSAFTDTGGVYMLVDGILSGEKLRIKTDTGVDGGWQRISVTFTPTATKGYSMGIAFTGFTGTVYADDIQLEIGDGPSNVNLMLNGSFEESGSWTTQNTGTMTTADKVSGSKSMMLKGAPDSREFVYQDVPINLPGTETYVVSGWANAQSVPTTNGEMDPGFGMYVIVDYTDNTYEASYLNFSSDIAGWQFKSMPIVPKQTAKTVMRIRVYCHYNYNANTVYFDNIALTREIAQTYKYNSDGKVVVATESGNKDTNYTYSGANLIKEITPGTGTFEYTYDSQNNMKQATNDTLTLSLTRDASGSVTKSTLSGKDMPNSITSSAALASDKNLLTRITNSNGATVNYAYATTISAINGTPTALTDGLGRNVQYSYDPQNGRPTLTYQSGLFALNYAYTKGQLAEITRSGFNVKNGVKSYQYYDFSYDVFGNLTNVILKTDSGSRTLGIYSYAARNGLLSKYTYGNGASTTYTYDTLNRLNKISYSDGTSYAYAYTGNGDLHRITDSATGQSYEYGYDSLGRLINFMERDKNGIFQYGHHKYDTANRLVKFSYAIPGIAPAGERYEEYTYNSTNGNLSNLRLASGDKVTYSYDKLSRLTQKSVGSVYNVQYGYRLNSSTNSTTNQVESKQYTIGSQATKGFTYTYDVLGNITNIKDKFTTFNSDYTYDEQRQLTKEYITNGYVDYTYLYTYDTYGNIRSKSSQELGKAKVTNTFTYENKTWQDLLTSYDGNTITYDSIGNPLQYYNGTKFTWKRGRQLSKAVNTAQGLTVSYTYDVDGTRIGKTVTSGDQSTDHKYFIQDGNIVAETRGTNKLEYIYDESGAPAILIYNGTTYYYITNMMGDVVHIVDAKGGRAASYTYNAWGQVVDSSGTLKDINPLRYRGYYYDTETCLYYLGSRYYDPATCRFISADGQLNSGFMGKNLFTYCDNNPVNGYDPLGFYSNTVKDVGGYFEVTTTIDGVDYNYTIKNSIVKIDINTNRLQDSAFSNKGDTLGAAMIDAARSIDGKAMCGRTEKGMNMEILIHNNLYWSMMEQSHTRVADMGCMDKKHDSYDSNAGLFEALSILPLPSIRLSPIEEAEKDGLLRSSPRSGSKAVLLRAGRKSSSKKSVLQKRFNLSKVFSVLRKKFKIKRR